MKKTYIISSLAILSLIVTGQGFGFFDELLKPTPKKSEQSQTQSGQQEQPGLLEGLGGAIGIDAVHAKR